VQRQLHDEIDAETARAYGWPTDLSDDDLLHRLVALNRARAGEEAQGSSAGSAPTSRNPDGRAAAPAAPAELDLGEAAAAKPAWPRLLPEQIAAVREALQDAGEAAPADIARRSSRPSPPSATPAPPPTAASPPESHPRTSGSFRLEPALTFRLRAQHRVHALCMRGA
jgi:hypothetical protein